jgi:hypothetical protein
VDKLLAEFRSRAELGGEDLHGEAIADDASDHLDEVDAAEASLAEDLQDAVLAGDKLADEGEVPLPAASRARGRGRVVVRRRSGGVTNHCVIKFNSMASERPS